jgi:4-alpha-glucanotransferase
MRAHCAAASAGCSSRAAGQRVASAGPARLRCAPRLSARAAPRCAAAAEAPAAAAEPAAPAASAIQPYPDPFPGLRPGDDLADEYGHPGPNPPKHRRAGVILHPTSLPGKYGMGEIGGEAFRFVDWLVETGMQLWQVRPLPSPPPPPGAPS